MTTVRVKPAKVKPAKVMAPEVMAPEVMALKAPLPIARCRGGTVTEPGG